MAYPNELGAKAEVTRLDSGNAMAARESQPHHRDTPPEDVYVVEAGLLARGSVLLSGLPETLAGFSDFVGQRLAAYSCGGSAGHYTGFPLSSGKLLLRRTTTGSLIGNVACASTRLRCGDLRKEIFTAFAQRGRNFAIWLRDH